MERRFREQGCLNLTSHAVRVGTASPRFFLLASGRSVIMQERNACRLDERILILVDFALHAVGLENVRDMPHSLIIRFIKLIIRFVIKS